MAQSQIQPPISRLLFLSKCILPSPENNDHIRCDDVSICGVLLLKRLKVCINNVQRLSQSVENDTNQPIAQNVYDDNKRVKDFPNSSSATHLSSDILIIVLFYIGLSICRFVKGNIRQTFAQCFVLSKLKSIHIC